MVEREMQFIYLHGFASSPRSQKARDLKARFAQAGISLITPDLNQGDFSHLTLSRQIAQVGSLLSANLPVVLVGSSLGGLTAAWSGEKYPQIERLVLLAPAFGFLDHWLPRLGPAQVERWRDEGVLPVYHYGVEQMLPLHYRFVEDALQYQEAALQRPVPTLILHGTQDEVIPVQASLEFARSRPWVELMQLPSDHSLTSASSEIWQAIQKFCQL